MASGPRRAGSVPAPSSVSGGGSLAPGRGAAGTLTRCLVGCLEGLLHPTGLWWMQKTPSACASRPSRTVHQPLLGTLLHFRWNALPGSVEWRRDSILRHAVPLDWLD